MDGTPAYASGVFDQSSMTGDFSLLPTSPGLDDGILIPGLNDDFHGTAPDMGAHEAETEPARYGIAASEVVETCEPTAEICGNAIDDDCDGLVDEDCGSVGETTDGGPGIDGSTVAGTGVFAQPTDGEDSGGCGCRTAGRGGDQRERRGRSPLIGPGPAGSALLFLLSPLSA